MKEKTAEALTTKTLSRRDFIKKTSLGALALAAAGDLPAKILNPFETESGSKSKVVLVHHSNVVDDTGRIQQPLLQKDCWKRS